MIVIVPAFCKKDKMSQKKYIVVETIHSMWVPGEFCQVVTDFSCTVDDVTY